VTAPSVAAHSLLSPPHQRGEPQCETGHPFPDDPEFASPVCTICEPCGSRSRARPAVHWLRSREDNERERSGRPRGQCAWPSSECTDAAPCSVGAALGTSRAAAGVRVRVTCRGDMVRTQPVVPADHIERAILVIRGRRVMLDADLASVYGVTTRRLNEQVKRNRDRFPADSCFV